MCVAVPGKLVEINGQTAKADFNGNVIDINISLIDAKLGDYVLVHAGCALEVLKKDKAEEILQLLEDLQEVMNE